MLFKKLELIDCKHTQNQIIKCETSLNEYCCNASKCCIKQMTGDIKVYINNITPNNVRALYIFNK